jgi:LPPG:FO 2-phospho-L-lactate transferase
MVKRKTNPKVEKVFFRGAASAKPAPRVIESIATASGVIICPSNPIVSIGAILGVKGIRSALRNTKARVVGISPIVGGKTVKGPADKLMKALGVDPTAVGVAEMYKDILDTLIVDRIDAKLVFQVRSLGIRAIVAQTLMTTLADKVRLARIAVSELKG